MLSAFGLYTEINKERGKTYVIYSRAQKWIWTGIVRKNNDCERVNRISWCDKKLLNCSDTADKSAKYLA